MPAKVEAIHCDYCGGVLCYVSPGDDASPETDRLCGEIERAEGRMEDAQKAVDACLRRHRELHKRPEPQEPVIHDGDEPFGDPNDATVPLGAHTYTHNGKQKTLTVTYSRSPDLTVRQATFRRRQALAWLLGIEPWPNGAGRREIVERERTAVVLAAQKRQKEEAS